MKRAVGSLVGLLVVVGICAAVGLARSATGGTSVAAAPVISLGQTVQGQLAIDEGNYRSFSDAEYYKVALAAGDHVTIGVTSAGNAAPCVDVYAPGANDANVKTGEGEVKAGLSAVANRFQSTFAAGGSGTYVIALNDLSSAANGATCKGAYQWPYSFTVQAVHALRLTLPAVGLHGGRNQVRVGVRDALGRPVDDAGLTVRLAVQWGHTAAKQLAQVHVRNGVAAFTFTLPKTTSGSSVRLVAAAEDNVSWASVAAARSYAIR
jgi:hypothetical protein